MSDGLNRKRVPHDAAVTCTLANTEYSYVIPPNTISFAMRLRTGPGKYCYVSGASGTTYKTLPAGSEYFEEDIAIPGDTPIYFQSTVAGDVMEITTWTKI